MFAGGDNNLYGFVANRPVGRVDPSGLFDPLFGACYGPPGGHKPPRPPRSPIIETIRPPGGTFPWLSGTTPPPRLYPDSSAGWTMYNNPYNPVVTIDGKQALDSTPIKPRPPAGLVAIQLPSGKVVYVPEVKDPLRDVAYSYVARVDHRLNRPTGAPAGYPISPTARAYTASAQAYVNATYPNGIPGYATGSNQSQAQAQLQAPVLIAPPLNPYQNARRCVRNYIRDMDLCQTRFQNGELDFTRWSICETRAREIWEACLEGRGFSAPFPSPPVRGGQGGWTDPASGRPVDPLTGTWQ